MWSSLAKGVQRVFPIFQDLTHGQADINATYTWPCPQCGHTSVYEGEGVERYQHPQAPLRATATSQSNVESSIRLPTFIEIV
jgi:hypothetical protein